MMICFRPPFNGDSETEVMENILKTDPPLKKELFKHVSSECTDLVKRLLVKNPAQRPSASEAYEHPWVQRHLRTIKKGSHDGVIDNISTFKVQPARLSSRTGWKRWSSPTSSRRF
jgi:serine/threonine protein kinase